MRRHFILLFLFGFSKVLVAQSSFDLSKIKSFCAKAEVDSKYPDYRGYYHWLGGAKLNHLSEPEGYVYMYTLCKIESNKELCLPIKAGLVKIQLGKLTDDDSYANKQMKRYDCVVTFKNWKQDKWEIMNDFNTVYISKYFKNELVMGEYFEIDLSGNVWYQINKLDGEKVGSKPK